MGLFGSKEIVVKVDGQEVADFPLGRGGDRRGFDSTGYKAARDWSTRYHGTGKRVEIFGPHGLIRRVG